MFLLLPYANDRRNPQFPAMTYSLILANVVVFLCLFPFGTPDHIAQTFGFSTTNSSWIYILTSMFVHVTPLHLLWNMLFLWLFGPSVEDVLGRLKYGLFYLASGAIALMLHSFIARNFMFNYADQPVIGASGAIAGILGIFAIRFYRTGIKVFWCVLWRCGTFVVPAMIGLGIWFLEQFVGGLYSVASPLFANDSLVNIVGHRIFSDGVGYWSHIGGMGFGMAAALAMDMRIQGVKEYHMDDAKISLEEGTTWHAAEHLCAVLACEPENVDVHANLARTYGLQGDADLAVAHYQKSIELYLKSKEVEKAIDCFLELRSFYRNAEIGLHSEFQIARLMDEADRHEPALQVFKEIISSHPGTPEAEVSLMRAGNLYMNELHNAREATVYFERFLAEYAQSSWHGLVAKSLEEARLKAKYE